MRNYLYLLKAQLINNFGLKKLAKKRGVIFVFLIGALVLGLVGYSCYVETELVCKLLTATGKIRAFHTLLTAILAIVFFMMSLHSVSSILFGGKDYENLSALPIKNYQVVIAKLTFTYIVDLLLSLFIMIIATVQYANFVEMSALYIVKIIITTFVAPLLSIAIAVIVSACIVCLTSRLKHKKLVQTLIYFVLLAGFIALFFTVSQKDIFKFLTSVYFLSRIHYSALHNALYMLLYVGINVASIGIVVVLISLFYVRICSIARSSYSSNKFKMKNYKQNGIIKMLVKKETKRLFTCPVYAMNTIFGLALGLVSTIVFALVLKSLVDDFQSINVSAIALYLPSVYTFMFMIAPMTACSLSLEGKNFWILQTSPVRMKDVFTAKILNDLIYALPVALASPLFFGFYVGLDPIVIVLITLCSLNLTVFSVFWGMLSNITFIKLDWEKESQPVKNSSAMLIPMFTAIIITAISVAILANVTVSAVLYLGIFAGVMFLLAIISIILVYTKGEKMLEKSLNKSE